ncbi:MAG: sulfurtransferase-like selenium metabolism protein YedF [Eubacteriales bacterium]|nr:sulfurtransferase-like selenium metabolism protein YedF [Eubacteriales bacterium]
MKLDARGLECPKPVVMALKELQNMKSGEVLDILVDNDAAVENLSRMVENQHCGKTVEQVEKDFLLRITKGQETEIQSTEAVCIPEERLDSTVIAIGTNVMGQGDEKLGKLLMKSYLYALTQQEVLPKRILFFNGGAHLTTEGSESLNDLKTLEERGVEIFTCGTCLDFYGIKELLRVGGVTNMYEIAESMEKAGKVIRI